MLSTESGQRFVLREIAHARIHLDLKWAQRFVLEKSCPQALPPSPGEPLRGHASPWERNSPAEVPGPTEETTAALTEARIECRPQKRPREWSFDPRDHHENGVSTPETTTRMEFRHQKRPREWSFDPRNDHGNGGLASEFVQNTILALVLRPKHHSGAPQKTPKTGRRRRRLPK